MRQAFQKWLLVAAVLMCGIDCRSQTNVYSQSVHMRWAIGSYPLRFGLEGYRKDTAGYYILAPSGRSVGSGSVPARVKDYTSVILGPIGFSVPSPPLAVALFSVGMFSVVALAGLAILRRLRGHENEQKTL
jgi:hypothetical protein